MSLWPLAMEETGNEDGSPLGRRLGAATVHLMGSTLWACAPASCSTMFGEMKLCSHAMRGNLARCPLRAAAAERRAREAQ